MRTGRRAAFDIGKARIGVAVSDLHGILASPREFVDRTSDVNETITALLAAVREDEPIEIYVGLPLNLKNESTESTQDALNIARALQGKTNTPIRLIDERMTTRIASGSMTAAGKNTKQQRGSIDSASAAVILESALQLERAQGGEPGKPIEEYESGE